MENLEKKLTTLSHIAKEFNEKNVTWAVGASMLLYFKGIASEFHDIDLMVAEEDVEIVKDLLLSFGSIKAPNPNIKYKTKYFLEFVVDGIDIDVMAGFIIVNKDEDFYFPLKKENINDYTVVNEIKIPLQSVEEWSYYYDLIGRDEKVKMIDASL